MSNATIHQANQPAADAFDMPALPQYSTKQIAAIWVAVTAPMSILGWLVAPWMAHHIHTRDPFIDSLLIWFDVGLIWQVVLVFALVRREQGSLAWSKVKDALWLRAPRDPRSRRIGGRVWLWAIAFTAFSAVINLVPIDPKGPLPRDFPQAILTDRVVNYFHGNWAGFALLVINAFMSPIAEELVFRGLLLPRIRGAFGKRDVLASATLFTAYHLHQPWSMPVTFIDGLVNQAYASKRFRSTWMGLITHTAPSFLIFFVVLNLVV